MYQGVQIYVYFSFSFRTRALRTLARTTQPVKPVLQKRDIAVCVPLVSRVRTARQVR